MTSEYPPDDGLLCRCYCMITALTQDCRIAWCMCVIGCVMSDACHAEYPQDGGREKKADGLYHRLIKTQIGHARDFT